MKVNKLILSAMLVLFILQSCTSSEEKAVQIVRDHIKESLYNPNSYHETNVRIDSIYSTDGSLDVIMGFMEVVDMIPEIMSLDRDIQSQKSDISMLERMPFPSSYDRQECESAKEKLYALQKKMTNRKEKVRERMQYYIDDIYSEGDPVFAGYYIEIGYSCKALNGNEMPGFSYFVFNPELQKIVYRKDLSPIEMLNLMTNDGKSMSQKMLEYIYDYSIAGEPFDVDEFISYVSL